jgi:hypothetical protein
VCRTFLLHPQPRRSLTVPVMQTPAPKQIYLCVTAPTRNSEEEMWSSDEVARRLSLSELMNQLPNFEFDI